VFKQVDIYKVMPDMCTRFAHVSFQYMQIMKDGHAPENMNYLKFSRFDFFPHRCDAMIKELDILMYNVNRYLIQKRRNFPRLYFMSNEELMEMVANGGNELALQNDLHKLFPGIYKLIFATAEELRAQAEKNRAITYEENADKDQAGGGMTIGVVKGKSKGILIIPG